MLAIPALHNPMRVLAGVVATLPLTRSDGEPLSPTSAAGRLMRRPTMTTTTTSFLDAVMWSLMVHGNAFAVPVEVTYRGEITRLELVHPSHITPAYRRYGDETDVEDFGAGAWLDGQYLAPADLIHWRETTMAGRSWGLSRLRLAARAIGLMISEEAHVASTYDDGAQPTGYWSSSLGRDSPVLEGYAAQLAAASGGRGNAVQVLGNDLEWHQVTMSHADIQMLESRQWSATQGAAMIGVPPHLVAAPTLDSETYASVRQAMAEFDALTLQRYRRIIGEELQLHGIDVALGSWELAQAPLAERIAAMSQAVSAGLCSPQQAAERLGWPPPDTPEPTAAPMDGGPPELTVVEDPGAGTDDDATEAM